MKYSFQEKHVKKDGTFIITLNIYKCTDFCRRTIKNNYNLRILHIFICIIQALKVCADLVNVML